MVIKFSKKECEDIIQNYYKTRENKEVIANIRCMPRFNYGILECKTEVLVRGQIYIVDMYKTFEETLSDEDMLFIIKTILNDTEYDVGDIYIDSKIEKVSAGLFSKRDEAFFNNVTVNVVRRMDNGRSLGRVKE